MGGINWAHEELKPKKDQNLKSRVTIWECTQGFDCPPTPKPVIPYFEGENDPNVPNSSSNYNNAADAVAVASPLSHDLAGLSCKDNNGPADNIAADKVIQYLNHPWEIYEVIINESI